MATEGMNNAASFASKFFKCALFREKKKKKIPKRDSFGLKFDELRGEREREREVALGRQKKKKKKKDKKPALICGNYLERR